MSARKMLPKMTDAAKEIEKWEEFSRFQRRIPELKAILAPEAIVLLFLAMGDKMWAGGAD